MLWRNLNIRNLGGVSLCGICVNLQPRLERNHCFWSPFCVFFQPSSIELYERTFSALRHLLTAKNLTWTPKTYNRALVTPLYFFVVFGFILALVYHTTMTSLKPITALMIIKCVPSFLCAFVIHVS